MNFWPLGLVWPHETSGSSGQGDTLTVADSTSQSGRRRKRNVKQGNVKEKKLRKKENIECQNTLRLLTWGNQTLLKSSQINEFTGACKLIQEV